MADIDIKELFKLSKYMHLHPTDTGSKSFDLIRFLLDLKDLPDYQLKESTQKVQTEEESENIINMYYSSKSIADDFLLIAPILLYRLTESALKRYLLVLYDSSLDDIVNNGRNNVSITYEQYIMKADINRIIILFKDSTASIDLKEIDEYNVIDELRILNNCLKHNHDYVSEELNEKNNFWTTDNLITVDDIQKRIADYDNGIWRFFYVLFKEIQPYFPI